MTTVDDGDVKTIMNKADSYMLIRLNKFIPTDNVETRYWMTKKDSSNKW